MTKSLVAEMILQRQTLAVLNKRQTPLIQSPWDQSVLCVALLEILEYFCISMSSLGWYSNENTESIAGLHMDFQVKTLNRLLVYPCS